MFAEGDQPSVPGSQSADTSIDMTSSGVNLHSGDVMLVLLQYNAGALVETVTDSVTGATFTHSYSVNVPSLVGASAAYVGFTAGTGGATAIQDVLGWSFTSYVPSPPPPPPPPSGITGFTNFTLNEVSGGPAGVPALSSDSKTLTLTTAVNTEANSAFYKVPVTFQNFSAAFTYTETGSSPADGFTFRSRTLPVAPRSLGARRANLGY